MRKILSILLLVTACSAVRAQQLTSEELAAAVQAEYLHAWQGYKTYAWGHDVLRPLSKKGEDLYGTTFYLTALEALDGLALMHLDKEADSTRNFLATHLSFDKDVFVPTGSFGARVLGALIANYQLSADQRLLDLANDLARRLVPAFISPTCMPYREINLKTGAVRGERSTPSEVGALLVDLGSLGMIMSNTAYFNYAKIALLQMYARRSPIDLVGEEIDISTGEWTKTEAHCGTAIGMYYEDLVKSTYLFEDPDCGEMWHTHYAAIHRFLLDSTATGYHYGHADMKSGKRTATVCGAHEAFLAMALALYKDYDRADLALRSAFLPWRRFGVGPDLYNYVTHTPQDPGCSLDPKLCESIYTLYRTSGDPPYLEMAKAVLDSITRYCRTPEGYAELSNVVTKTKRDRLDPSFFSGTLKYLFLVFSPPEVLDFGKVMMDPFGHPIRKVW
jgi:ER degradation enhancer, mannosidase alpha-like 2